MTVNVPLTFVDALFNWVVVPLVELPMVVVADPVRLMSVAPVITVLLNDVFPPTVNPWRIDVFWSVVSPVPATLILPVPLKVIVLSVMPTEL